MELNRHSNVLSTPKGVIMRRMRTGRDAALIPAPQDDLCLAFANTLSWRGSPAPSESLGGIDDLLGWLANTAKIPPQTIEAVGKRLRRQSSEAAKLFSEAIELREAIYRPCRPLAASQPIAEKDLALLNRTLAEAPRREKLAHAEGGYAWEVKKIDASAAGLLAPVLWSAA